MYLFDISRSAIILWRMNVFMPSKAPPTVSLVVLIIIAGFDSDIHGDKAALAQILKAAPRYACVGG